MNIQNIINIKTVIADWKITDIYPFSLVSFILSIVKSFEIFHKHSGYIFNLDLYFELIDFNSIDKKKNYCFHCNIDLNNFFPCLVKYIENSASTVNLVSTKRCIRSLPIIKISCFIYQHAQMCSYQHWILFRSFKYIKWNTRNKNARISIFSQRSQIKYCLR